VPHLIISDIHGNWEALEAVLADANGRFEKILCLGDLVGYGADPNAVTAWAREHTDVIVRGNHDKACTGDEPLDDYSPSAKASADWTRNELTAENRDFLRSLPCGPIAHEDATLVHGSPSDEDEYLISIMDAAVQRGAVTSPVTLFGHTHLQGGFLLAPGGTKHIAPREKILIEPDYHFLINPGSVGQPRDGNWRAAYAVYSPLEHAVEFHRVAYDVDRAAAKIRAAELPEFLAARLYEGR
jgi:diadenosine tetraphosphatase ApaH/serine/threonine PP2A family protein phosphatase